MFSLLVHPSASSYYLKVHPERLLFNILWLAISPRESSIPWNLRCLLTPHSRHHAPQKPHTREKSEESIEHSGCFKSEQYIVYAIADGTKCKYSKLWNMKFYRWIFFLYLAKYFSQYPQSDLFYLTPQQYHFPAEYSIFVESNSRTFFFCKFRMKGWKMQCQFWFIY